MTAVLAYNDRTVKTVVRCFPEAQTARAGRPVAHSVSARALARTMFSPVEGRSAGGLRFSIDAGFCHGCSAAAIPFAKSVNRKRRCHCVCHTRRQLLPRPGKCGRARAVLHFPVEREVFLIGKCWRVQAMGRVECAPHAGVELAITGVFGKEIVPLVGAEPDAPGGSRPPFKKIFRQALGCFARFVRPGTS